PDTLIERDNHFSRAVQEGCSAVGGAGQVVREDQDVVAQKNWRSVAPTGGRKRPIIPAVDAPASTRTDAPSRARRGCARASAQCRDTRPSSPRLPPPRT